MSFMFKNRIYEDLTLICRRAKLVFLALAGLLILVLGYYWKVQILDYKKYWQMAEANRLRESALPAARGLIRDRNGVILADNTAGFKASVIPENVVDPDASCRNIALLLGVDEKEIRSRLEKYKDAPGFEPVIVRDNLTVEEVARIEVRRLEFPELIVETEPKRSYPFGVLGAHVLGYLQELTPEEIQADPAKKRHWGDMGGATGIERQYDAVLTGANGRKLEIVDSLGKSRGEVATENPRPGKDVILTLDYDLQKKAEELLQGLEGAIVAMDPRSGEILALASFPTFDPNKFISRFTPREWTDLISDPANPLEDKALRGLYSPGSIFKVAMALGGLESGIITEDTTFYCSGSEVIYGNTFNCWFAPGHGRMNLAEGIKNSCNVYFYNLGRRMGIEAIAQTARRLGLGSRTGIDLPGEKEGLVPDPEWKKRTSKTSWFPGETISVAIGQGPLLVTPVQTARLTACVANRGVLVTPRLSGSGDAAGRTQGGIPRASFESVIEGMWRSVNAEGTGRGAIVKGFDVCGKTGSTQWISRERAEKLAQQGKDVKKTHSWFSGFAPRSDPRIVVTVLVEFGGMGGAAAAPLAGELFKLYRKKYDR